MKQESRRAEIKHRRLTEVVKREPLFYHTTSSCTSRWKQLGTPSDDAVLHLFFLFFYKAPMQEADLEEVAPGMETPRVMGQIGRANVDWAPRRGV